jgi:hypothetical protein
MKYNLTLYPEIKDNESSSYRLAIIFGNGTRADVGFTTKKDWQFAEYPCLYWQNMYLKAAKKSGEIQNGSAYEATIDGKEGIIIRQEILRPGRNKVINSTNARYWLDAEEIKGYGLMAAKTEVQMISILPENLTSDLINTIHVEANNQESKMTTMAYKGEQNITIRDQTNADPSGTVIIPEVISQVPAYVVVLDLAGDILGYQAISDGVNKNVTVMLNATPRSQWLYATLNKGGAAMKPWWMHPFDPDAEYTSPKFFDSRVASVGVTAPKAVNATAGKSWLDDEKSTYTIINSKPNPDYSRYSCIEQMTLNGYPESTASFYCD